MSPKDDWQPPAGMVKRHCLGCDFDFATRDPEGEYCPDCAKGRYRLMRGPDAVPDTPRRLGERKRRKPTE